MPTLAEIRAERARRVAEKDRKHLLRNIDRIRERCVTLSGFVREAWHVLEPDAALVWNWHLDALCAHLEAITEGRINRLLVNVPPGSSKSLFVSVMWQSWEWGPQARRSLRYLTTAFNDGPVKRDTRKCRDLIMSDWYQALWPEVRLTRTGEMSFANSDTGTREGVPFGSLTSQRGDRLLIDDPHSTETAESPAERTSTTRKFREGATNRLNDQEKSAIVVVMQRLHEQDVSGVILELGMEYVHLNLPMEFEVKKRCRTSIGFVDPRRHEGDLLDPVRFPRETVEKLKRDMGSYAYAGQYQQRPAPREGGMFKRGWFDVVDVAPATAQKVRRWDFAATDPKEKKRKGGDPDWTVGLLLSEYRGIYYVEAVAREQESPAGVERLLRAVATQDGKAIKVVIPQDPGAAGKSNAAHLIKMLVGWNVRAVLESGSKEVRANPVSAQAEAGNIKLVRGPWNEAFLEEVSMFPNGSHDDQVDGLTGAFAELVTSSTYTLGNVA